ncbi:unnamed protein product [Prorocentrum cordatum]|uniref:Uncharacterized protein n=1 Tax=Prorocentrum cordatum TaxID=2364126 RepID=A0ABN9T1W0_9DINO|nr:unnamed protein product [Polarella glacialis]
MLLNDWGAPAGSSPAFYVHAEGLASGVVYQVANVIATQAVKKVGIGSADYTVHEVSNVGATLLIGFVGPELGLPVKVPSNISLAIFGAFLTGLGMIPTMLMTDAPEEKPAEIKQKLLVASAAGQASGQSGRRSLRNVDFGAADEASMLEANAHSWDMFQVNAHTWDGSTVPPRMRTTLKQFQHTTGGLPTTPAFLEEDEEEQEESLQEGWGRKVSNENTKKDKVVGLVLSLIAGALFGIMFAPMPYWQARMSRAGVSARPADFVFAVCVGTSLTSTAWLLFWSAIKRFQNRALEKSVLRPALFAGAIYYYALLLEFSAMALLPYAVAYVACTGFALAVSMGWGMFCFGEMTGSHNRLMAALSFLGVILGAVVLAAAA